MYNRYIPPTKGRPTVDQSQTQPAAPVANFSAAQPYSRYIPGQAPAEPAPSAPPQPQRIVFNDADLPPIDHSKRARTLDEELPGCGENKKSKKTKSKRGKDVTEHGAGEESKSRQREKTVTAEENTVPETQPAANGDVLPDADAEPVPNSAEKRPKRDKKKKKKTIDRDGDTSMFDAEDDSIRQRHKGVFEKVQKALQVKEGVEDSDEEESEPAEEHGLEPLPQPEPVIFDESKLTYETLPPWLASPVRVGPGITRPFTKLGISAESSKVLESKGFGGAFAVQTAVLPLLLPSPDRQGDVVVAAPTGSGKTLSYVLPMVHDVSQSRITRLRGLIVLPTRDLVQQVQLACEACAPAFALNGGKRVKVGTAIGNRVFRDEQSTIMGIEQRYDPAGYEKSIQKRDRLTMVEDSDEEDDGFELNPTEPLPHHVITHVSKVDILICTPGRLVEHITKTPGFSLDYVRWLVVDEADKLLAQDFQKWLDTVMGPLSNTRPGARDFPTSNKSGVRKVILSATMTRDLSLLNGLKLFRPKLVVVEGTKAGEQNLPPLLKEYGVKVRDPSLKPLYLVELLRSKHIAPVSQEAPESMESDTDESGSSSSESESETDSDLSASDSDSESSSSSEDESNAKRTAASAPTKINSRPPKFPTTALIFTKSNESALRLSRLLALLAPDLAPLIGTLTSSTKTSRRARTLRAFASPSSQLRILVASDLVSRGIDLLNLEHVINYDLPVTETSYVHRVGRTARAGRKGCAWTLVEHAEARRFWREFAGEGNGAVTSIGREGTVERVNVVGEGGFGEEKVEEYERALEVLRREAVGGEGRR
ncbi:P-loop containing nucleoside triphosphate hydrolase protein [Dichotomopilus funicola]|uniref:ATP-dependent RNA helicase n=1 Tax=Dichotomopilus funicola TaxID=1934379 RepID=A0AAN6UZ97_9PEZI|nr:P-loop containing nucleoside triphosphate hydrolase protein [Dichotomopilus funicola]